MNSKHFFEPLKCWRLRYAVDGTTTEGMKHVPNADEVTATRKKLETADFRELKAAIAKEGWKYVAVAKITGANSTSTSKPTTNAKTADAAALAGNKDKGKATWEGTGSINAAVLDPNLLDDIIWDDTLNAGIYSTMEFQRHPLSDSTLVDNCGATHLVNSIDKLVPGSFKRTTGESVDAGTSSLPIVGRGTRIFENAMHGPAGPYTRDLTLSNVAVVEGFNVNIISESLLAQSGVWYNGADTTLRVGSAEESHVVRNLQRRWNLMVFEYKPVDNCSRSSQLHAFMKTRRSPAVMMYPTISRRLHPLKKYTF